MNDFFYLLMVVIGGFSAFFFYYQLQTEQIKRWQYEKYTTMKITSILLAKFCCYLVVSYVFVWMIGYLL